MTESAENVRQHLLREIERKGALTISDYMEICLGLPQRGYYHTRDPFGEAGDFTTSPEISQMFGELIGGWIGDIWQRSGGGEFMLVECGPGRGTLMADILRSLREVAGFTNAVDVRLVETSGVMRSQQEKKLSRSGVGITWHENIEDLPLGRPLIVVGNEFLDALGVRQLIQKKSGLLERKVTFKDNRFEYLFAPAEDDARQFVYSELGGGAAEEVIFEMSPARQEWLMKIARRIKTQAGAALFIDYGKNGPLGDTFQAVKAHKYENPLLMPGEADLTAHVDFRQLEKAAKLYGLNYYGPQEQGQFLTDLGIKYRARALQKNASASDTENIEGQLYRLISEKEMGVLFKVASFVHKEWPVPAGF